MGKVRMWKNGGKEDTAVEKLINEGTITKDSTGKTLKILNPAVFGPFSNNVIRNHLNELKRRNGLFLAGDDAAGVEAEDNDDENNQAERTTCGVVKLNEDAKPDSLPAIKIDHHNFPFICGMYKDPNTRMDVVLIMVNLPGGAENVGMDLNENGTIVTFKYDWPKAWYNVKTLFEKFVDAGETTLVHPMVLSVESALEKCRPHIDSAPQGTMTINLPIKVQTDPYTWKKNGISRTDGMQILMVEFVGFVKEYHKVKQNAAFVFDK